jgi:hypothetical protein
MNSLRFLVAAPIAGALLGPQVVKQGKKTKEELKKVRKHMDPMIASILEKRLAKTASRREFPELDPMEEAFANLFLEKVADKTGFISTVLGGNLKTLRAQKEAQEELYQALASGNVPEEEGAGFIKRLWNLRNRGKNTKAAKADVDRATDAVIDEEARVGSARTKAAIGTGVGVTGAGLGALYLKRRRERMRNQYGV